MGFVKHLANFTKLELVKNAIVYASMKTGVDVSIIEEIIKDYFDSVRQLMADCIHDKISLYRWGTLRKIRANREIIQIALEPEYSDDLLNDLDEDDNS